MLKVIIWLLSKLVGIEIFSVAFASANASLSAAATDQLIKAFTFHISLLTYCEYENRRRLIYRKKRDNFLLNIVL